jgi:Cys-tRNA(Pro)/Cys-tRNA(Cys) deacylase
MTAVNNVTRFLQSQKIEFVAHELPPEKLGAMITAEILDVDPARVFKTIVATRTRPGKPILAVVPGDRELNLKLAAKAAGEKKIKLASHAQAEELTGFQTGGISPLALINRGFQVLIDQTALEQDTIFISGGQRGLSIELNPVDLISLIKVKTAPLS